MKLSSIFRSNRTVQPRELLGMTFMSPIGIYVKEKATGINYAELMLNTAYSYVIVNCMDLAATIKVLRRLPREYNIIAHLDVKQEYQYEGSAKNMEAAFAILYDFVDAFLISSIDSMSGDVDSLLNLRMYNDEYRPIILEVRPDLLYTDIDEILDYAMLNNVDGCLISDMRHLAYANSRCKGYLNLIAGGVDSVPEMIEAKNNGAELYCTDSSHKSVFRGIAIGRRLLRYLRKGA